MAAGLRRSTSVFVDLALEDLFLCDFVFPVFFVDLDLLDLDLLDLGGFKEEKECFTQNKFDSSTLSAE